MHRLTLETQISFRIETAYILLLYFECLNQTMYRMFKARPCFIASRPGSVAARQCIYGVQSVSALPSHPVSSSSTRGFQPYHLALIVALAWLSEAAVTAPI